MLTAFPRRPSRSGSARRSGLCLRGTATRHGCSSLSCCRTPRYRAGGHPRRSFAPLPCMAVRPARLVSSRIAPVQSLPGIRVVREQLTLALFIFETRILIPTPPSTTPPSLRHTSLLSPFATAAYPSFGCRSVRSVNWCVGHSPTDAMTLHIKMSLADLILSNDAEGLDRAQELYQQAIAGWAATHGRPPTPTLCSVCSSCSHFFRQQLLATLSRGTTRACQSWMYILLFKIHDDDVPAITITHSQFIHHLANRVGARQHDQRPDEPGGAAEAAWTDGRGEGPDAGGSGLPRGCSWPGR